MGLNGSPEPCLWANNRCWPYGGSVAHELGTGEPVRALRLLEEARHVARSLRDDRERKDALYEIARVLVRYTPDDVVELAKSITRPGNRSLALRDVAEAVTEQIRQRPNVSCTTSPKGP